MKNNKFNCVQFFEYPNVKNPYVLELRKTFLLSLRKNANIHSSKLEQLIINWSTLKVYERPKYILCNQNIEKYIYALGLSNIGKVFGRIKVISSDFIELSHFIYFNDEIPNPFDELDNQYLIRSFLFNGYKFPKLPLKIGQKTGLKLKKQYNLDYTPDKITIDELVGETDDIYHFRGNKTYMWVDKDDVENPFEVLYDTKNIDFDTLESSIKKGWTLFPFQKNSISFLNYTPKGFLLLDQGLGKTVCSLLASQIDSKKVLIVTLASLKTNWKREVENIGETCKIISSSNWDDTDCKFTIINYEILKNFQDFSSRKKKEVDVLFQEKYDTIILDEAQKVKNPKSKRSKIIKYLSKAPFVKKIWGLSGTLIEKNEDLYNVCSVLNLSVSDAILPGNYWNYKDYFLRYCNRIEITMNGRNILIPVKPKKGEDKNENTNTSELRTRVQACFYRVMKKNVLEEFPSKYRIPLYFTMTVSQEKKYDKLYDEYIKERESKGYYTDEESKHLVESIKMRQYLAKIKVPHIISFVKNKIEDEQTCIVFTHFKEEFDLLTQKLKNKCVSVHASNSNDKNQTSIDKFQNGEVPIIVGNIKTLGTGHNLTKGDNIIICSPDWNDGEHSQAEDRAWRLGRKEDVNVFYTLFENSKEEEVFNRANSKKENKDLLFED